MRLIGMFKSAAAEIPLAVAIFGAVFALSFACSEAANAAQPFPLANQALVPISQRVFLNSAVTPETRTRILGLVEQARAQVTAFYNGLVSDPEIVVCTTTDCFRKAGGVGLGFSDGSNILISPYGGNTAIISHEWSHVELANRLGGFARVVAKVPQWFDEGLAVLASQAPEFSEEAWLKATDKGRNAPSLSELESLSDWIRITGTDGANMQLSYGTARHEVGRWYAKVGHAGLMRLIDALNRGEGFYAAYWRIENSADHPATLRIAAFF